VQAAVAVQVAVACASRSCCASRSWCIPFGYVVAGLGNALAKVNVDAAVVDQGVVHLQVRFLCLHDRKHEKQQKCTDVSKTW
jgi:hypothetical protein